MGVTHETGNRTDGQHGVVVVAVGVRAAVRIAAVHVAVLQVRPPAPAPAVSSDGVHELLRQGICSPARRGLRGAPAVTRRGPPAAAGPRGRAGGQRDLRRVHGRVEVVHEAETAARHWNLHCGQHICHLYQRFTFYSSLQKLFHTRGFSFSFAAAALIMSD